MLHPWFEPTTGIVRVIGIKSMILGIHRYQTDIEAALLPEENINQGGILYIHYCIAFSSVQDYFKYVT